MDTNGLTPLLMNGREVDTKIKSESITWDKVIKARNIPTQ